MIFIFYWQTVFGIIILMARELPVLSNDIQEKYYDQEKDFFLPACHKQGGSIVFKAFVYNLEQFCSLRELLFVVEVVITEQRNEKLRLIDGLHILRRPWKVIVITINSFFFLVRFFKVRNWSLWLKELSQLIRWLTMAGRNLERGRMKCLAFFPNKSVNIIPVLWMVRSCRSLEPTQPIAEERVCHCVTKTGSGAEEDGVKRGALPPTPIIRMTSHVPLSLTQGLRSKVLGLQSLDGENSGSQNIWSQITDKELK